MISIHALLAESDCRPKHSTNPKDYFYPRSPCGERRWLRCWQLAARDISIHALLAESDSLTERRHWQVGQFLSTLSLRRATRTPTTVLTLICISIHALLAESDARRASRQQPAGISIHALLAESDVSPDTSSVQCRLFLSTLSLRRATYDFPRRDHIH